MDSSWIDHLPSNERMKIRKRLRSSAEYERARENVKGPEDLEKELDKSAKLAELHFALESEPTLKSALTSQIEKDMKKEGAEHVLDLAQVSPEGRQLLEDGKFTVNIAPHPQTNQDALVAVPEGKPNEKLPIKPSFSDQYIAQFFKDVD